MLFVAIQFSTGEFSVPRDIRLERKIASYSGIKMHMKPSYQQSRDIINCYIIKKEEYPCVVEDGM
jgi:hypothetical protein